MPSWLTDEEGDLHNVDHAVYAAYRYTPESDVATLLLSGTRRPLMTEPSRDVVLASFPSESSAEPALQAFVERGWIRALHEQYVAGTLGWSPGRVAVNPRHVTELAVYKNSPYGSDSVDYDVVALTTDGGGPWRLAANIGTRAEAQLVLATLRDQISVSVHTAWSDPDFTNPTWSTFSAAQDEAGQRD